MVVVVRVYLAGREDIEQGVCDLLWGIATVAESDGQTKTGRRERWKGERDLMGKQKRERVEERDGQAVKEEGGGEDEEERVRERCWRERKREMAWRRWVATVEFESAATTLAVSVMKNMRRRRKMLGGRRRGKRERTDGDLLLIHRRCC
uniref:Uncharacterized protein n=1 Tax=Nelumbo nucifera TaxID=4432 RepID=A0A822Y4F9_NELNU|nr:TPA_asm: hypothetical protein HUJ06_027959 [Nelumbo nucifera]